MFCTFIYIYIYLHFVLETETEIGNHQKRDIAVPVAMDDLAKNQAN